MRTHQVVRPSDEVLAPPDLPDGSFTRVQDRLLVSEPALLVQYEVAGHAARDEGARAALREVGLEGDSAEGTLHVEDVRLGIGERIYRDLS